jgi:GAF domain-containing protein
MSLITMGARDDIAADGELISAQSVSRFAAALPADHHLGAAVSTLTKSLATLLGLSGIGVTVAGEDGHLLAVAAVGDASAELDRHQTKEQAGPCWVAYTTDDVVRVTDAGKEPRWPEFSSAARRLGTAGVAGMPMRLDGRVIGVLSLYSSRPRCWSDEDMAVARVLADVATSCVVNASRLCQQEDLNAHLQRALKSRVVIEQAKGMTASRLSVSIDQAYRLIRRYARDHNARLQVVAEAIVAQKPSGLSPATDLPDLLSRSKHTSSRESPVRAAS